MNDQPEPQIASLDAIEKSRAAAEAIEISRSTQLKSMLDDVEKRNIATLSGVLTKVFGDFESSGRFIDLKKIPLICAQISQIHTDIGNTNVNVEKINESIKWVVRVIIGTLVTGLIGLGFLVIQLYLKSLGG